MEYAVRTSGLTKRFGDRVALQGLDLEVPVGSVFGYLGPNGAGKTTTIKLLAGLYRPTAGRAVVLGADVSAERDTVQGRIGYLPGDFAGYADHTGRRLIGLLGALRGGVDWNHVGALAMRFDVDLDRRLGTLARQPADDRDHPSLHGQTRAAHPRRADAGTRSLDAAGVPGSATGDGGLRGHRPALLARAVRGRGDCRHCRHPRRGSSAGYAVDDRAARLGRPPCGTPLRRAGLFVDDLASWRAISPFHQALHAGPLATVVPVSYLWLVLVSATAVLTAVPLWSRRDIGASR